MVQRCSAVPHATMIPIGQLKSGEGLAHHKSDANRCDCALMMNARAKLPYNVGKFGIVFPRLIDIAHNFYGRWSC